MMGTATNDFSICVPGMLMDPISAIRRSMSSLTSQVWRDSITHLATPPSGVGEAAMRRPRSLTNG